MIDGDGNRGRLHVRKRASGTWPPLANTAEEAAGPLNAAEAGDVAEPVTMELAAFPALLMGPAKSRWSKSAGDQAEPPAVVVAPVRM